MIALGLAALAYNPSPVYEVHGAGDVSANGFYVFFRRADDGNSAVFARAYEKRGPADHLSPPSELEWQRVASGAVHWALKRQRFAPRCFRPAASYNDSCGRCCTLPGTAPVYGARTPPSATAPHEAWPAPPATGWTVALGGGSGDSEHSRSAAAGGTLLPAPSVRRLEAPNAAATALTMAPLAECLHRATVLLSRQHEAEAVALHAQCAGAAEAQPLALGVEGGAAVAAAVAGARPRDNATVAFRAQLLLSQSAQGLRRDGAALMHALKAVGLACGRLRGERDADGARKAPSWPCSVSLLEATFIHTKLGNTSAAAATFKRAINWDPVSAGAAAPPLAPPGLTPPRQSCSVLHNGTVVCEVASKFDCQCFPETLLQQALRAVEADERHRSATVSLHLALSEAVAACPQRRQARALEKTVGELAGQLVGADPQVAQAPERAHGRRDAAGQPIDTQVQVGERGAAPDAMRDAALELIVEEVQRAELQAGAHR